MKSCPSCNYKNSDMDTICAACGVGLPTQDDNNFDKGVNNNFDNGNQIPRVNSLSIVSLSTGIIGFVLSCCCGCFVSPLSIAGIVTGIITLKNLNSLSHKNDKIFAIIGIATGGVALIIIVSLFILRSLGIFNGYYSDYFDMLDNY